MDSKMVLVKTQDYVMVVFTMVTLSDASKKNNIDPSMQGVDSFRKMAWRSLSDGEKITVVTDWEEALVEKGHYWLTGDEAIVVTFRTTDDELMGPIVVYIDPKTFEILGQALRNSP